MTQYISEENLKLYDKLLKEYILTKSESLLDLLSYGVEWDTEVADPHLTRVGNLNWHRTLPIQSLMKRCIAQKEKIMYWLDPNDGRFRENNTGYVFTDQQMTFVEKISDSLYKYTYVNSLFDTLRFKHLYLKVGDEYIFKIIDIDPATNTATVTGEIKFEDTSTYLIEIGSCTNGYDGTVEVYVPEFYIRSFINGTKRLVRISPFLIDSSWLKLNRCLLSAFKCTVLNTVPENMGFLSTLPVNSAISVANVETYCRGGRGNTIYDQYLETDPFRSNLGKPHSSMQRDYLRRYARNAGKEPLNYIQYKNILYWLWVIEYANFNSQDTYNPELTVEGYKLGGLGRGTTNILTQCWNYYNDRQPIVPCGYTLDIGNTGSKQFTIIAPSEEGGEPNTEIVSWATVWRGVENMFGDCHTQVDGVVLLPNEDNTANNVYITNNPLYYGDTESSTQYMEFIGQSTKEYGYIKEFDLKDLANIIPISIGGNITAYKCDLNTKTPSNVICGLYFGGYSNAGYGAGIAMYSASYGILHAGSFHCYRLIKELPETEYMVITSDSNAPLMTAMYNAGLASNPDYMTKSEAEKVTTLNGIDFTNVVSFDEFKYFTGVTEIPNACFLKNTSLTSIICPDSLVTIKEGAFGSCSNLTYIKIGKYVTTIGSYAFGGCSKLTSVIIPNFVTSIGEGAFLYCYELKSVKLGNSLTSISSYMFRECGSLTSVIIPDSVTTIGTYAFNRCARITSIAIPDSVTLIDRYAFLSCNGLISIIIGNSVTSIGNRAFGSCSSLESINVKSGNTVYDSRDNCNALIETDTNTLIRGCKNTIIPDSVTSTGSYSFDDCNNLTQITIPNSVTSIEWATFEGCRHLTSLRISKYVTLIKGQITASCTSLSEIVVEEGNPNYDSRDNCNAIISTATNKMFSACKNTIIPNTVTTIGGYAFYGHSTLTSIVIPKSVTAIEANAFYRCNNLTSITCLATTAPTVSSDTFGRDNWSYTGRNTYNQGVNKLYIPTGATGYDTSYWLDPLQNAEKCGFTIEYIDNN